MTAWFRRHTAAATAALFAVAVLAVLAVIAAGNGHVLAGVGLALLALAVWQPIQPTISPRQPRRRDDY